MEEPQQRIDLKEAVRRATELITQDLYGGYELRNLLLEEVEREGDTWYVTIGFSRPTGDESVLGALSLPPRVFKQVKVNAKTGEFLGMKDRKLVSPSDGPSSGRVG